MNIEATNWLASQRDAMRADLTALCNQNSGSENLQGLLGVASWLQSWMGIDTASFQSIPLGPRLEVDELGREVELPSAPALRWDCRPQADKRVLLAIHYDTVFAPAHEFQQCDDLGDDRLGGPGVADAKGGIVVIANALRAVERFHLADDCGWTILLNPDEEIGSPHSTELLSSVAKEFDFGLLFEPSLPSGELVAERKGSGNYTVVIRGVAAHAGRHFEDGRNAMAMLCRLLGQLDELNGCRDGLTLNVGSVQGGGPVNIVPELAIGRFNVRVADAESIDWFETQLQSRLDAINSRPGLACRRYGGITSPPKQVDAGVRCLINAIERASQATRHPIGGWVATGGVCDGNKLAAAGLPNVDTLGPVGGGLHGKQEWVQLSTLVVKAELVARLLSDYSDGKFEMPQES